MTWITVALFSVLAFAEPPGPSKNQGEVSMQSQNASTSLEMENHLLHIKRAHDSYWRKKPNARSYLTMLPAKELTANTKIRIKAKIDGVMFSEGYCATQKRKIVFETERSIKVFLLAARCAGNDVDAEIEETIGALPAGRYDVEVLELIDFQSISMGRVAFEVVPVASDEHALASAILESDEDLAELLSKRKFSHETLNAGLNVACRNADGYAGKISRLIDEGAKPETALHYAVKIDAYLCLKTLLQGYKANPNLDIKDLPTVLVWNDKGRNPTPLPGTGTPLMFAVEVQNLEAMELLMGAGAGPYIRANDGNSAYSLVSSGKFGPEHTAAMMNIINSTSRKGMMGRSANSMIKDASEGASNTGYGIACIVGTILGGKCY
ncbi:hypothetical protein [Variovorax paradoxus]|uniref:hypothetical protein n=1 Tax=Variovorax paradoxus TaxID=34073 RepID=UPI003D661255